MSGRSMRPEPHVCGAYPGLPTARPCQAVRSLPAARARSASHSPSGQAALGLPDSPGCPRPWPGSAVRLQTLGFRSIPICRHGPAQFSGPATAQLPDFFWPDFLAWPGPSS
ncbi:hypothetical protein R1flu_017156 [Riccia fluitans]|uniref:Uncharacterized protein n=1 Tax=Riccia fluitans TaxID=41844 RepID=A0ABD1XH55_9MARC